MVKRRTAISLALLLAALGSLTNAWGDTPLGVVAPTIALNRLKEGNARFVEGRSERPRQGAERIKEVSKGQNPFAVVVGCSDSRVPNEIIFDQGLGDLFIVRTAGQVSAAASYGSIEFAEEVLGAKLIVVLGHTKCGGGGGGVRF